MKRTNIYLQEDQSRLLRHLAIEEGRSFTDVVREALEEYLARRGLTVRPSVAVTPPEMPDDEWRARFDAVLARIRSRVPPDMTPDEIEAEITAASEEVRQLRKRKSAARG